MELLYMVWRIFTITCVFLSCLQILIENLSTILVTSDQRKHTLFFLSIIHVLC